MIPRQTMLIDIYIAALQKSEHKAEWNAFLRFLKTYPAQKILAENGYRPVNKQALTEFRRKFPVRPGETKITNPVIGGWRAVDKKWFDPNKSIMPRSRSRSGSPLPEPLSRHRGSRRQPCTQGESHVGSLPAVGFITTFLPIVVALPIAAVVWKSTGNGGRLLGGRLLAAGRRGAQAHAADLDARRAHERGVRDDDRVDARPGRVPGQELRQRGHRPAVRAADDRRGLVIIALYGLETPIDFDLGSFHLTPT